MAGFGEQLRMERVAKGIALEDVSAITKISQRYLIALEQEKFNILPGGILNKGIVRGYANVVGLDPDEWISRYLKAFDQAGLAEEEERTWEGFAKNVGRARFDRHEYAILRLRWIATLLLFLIAISFCFLAVRYYGLRSGWWPTLLPRQMHIGWQTPYWLHKWLHR